MKKIQLLRLNILRRRFIGLPVSPNSIMMHEYKSLLPISLQPFTQAMLVGLMLGDVSLKTNKSLTGSYIQFEWGDKHMAYAFYVWHLLYPYCLELSRRQVRINHLGKSVVTWCFQTVTHPAFLFLNKLFIVNGIKHILPDLLANAITPISLAFWFMDDGSQLDYRSYGLQYNTHAFSVEEVNSLCTILQDKFGLQCWIKYNKGKPTIVISGHSYNNFFKLVNNYIHESMRFKFPSGTRTKWLD